jgi:hypothetical protein
MYKDQGSPTGSFNGLHLKSNFLAVSQSFSLEHTRALRGAKESFPACRRVGFHRLQGDPDLACCAGQGASVACGTMVSSTST